MNIIKKNNNINKDEKAKSLYKDIYGNDVICENLGDRKIYWVPNVQK